MTKYGVFNFILIRGNPSKILVEMIFAKRTYPQYVAASMSPSKSCGRKSRALIYYAGNNLPKSELAFATGPQCIRNPYALGNFFDDQNSTNRETGGEVKGCDGAKKSISARFFVCLKARLTASISSSEHLDKLAMLRCLTLPFSRRNSPGAV